MLPAAMDALPVDPAPSSDGSSSPSDTAEVHTQAPKRTATDAGLKTHGQRAAKSVKRRASKACQCCRARKVRCNVVEHGPPCTNCRLDEVECIVSESKRKKKWTINNALDASPQSIKDDSQFKSPLFQVSTQPPFDTSKRSDEHVPHALYQDLSGDASLTSSHRRTSVYSPQVMMNLQRLGLKTQLSDPSPALPNIMTPVTPSFSLPLYIKPLPSRLPLDDVLYLQKKGALTIPQPHLRDQLLKHFVEFVYPYMPLLNIHELVATIDRSDGTKNVSLLLFQAIMFAAVATVDMRHLKNAGYATRRDARRDFFQRTRLLYDFDIEIDRISLIQSLLLMTFWYETPDDQKDSHHWIGIAVSLSHTIGLHRNPDKSSAMNEGRRKLWKRIWWSIYIRDRLVALGMRRPTRVKDADFDVPMLTLDDFDCQVLADGPTCIPDDCTVLRDIGKQRLLAMMCIEKAKLCVCMSHVLSVQYSVLNNANSVVDDEGSSTTTVRLAPKKDGPDNSDVQVCDEELQNWKDSLPSEVQYEEPTWFDVDSGNESVVLSRSLLHMIYYSTLSALHRPQVIPSAARPMQIETVERSRKAVRLATSETTSMANSLFRHDMVRYLPTTGTTVLLPAIIIHLLDIKAPDEATRRSSLQGFCQCMQVMGKLRDIYAAADYSTAFLEAAIRKAEITLPPSQPPQHVAAAAASSASATATTGAEVTHSDGIDPQRRHSSSSSSSHEGTRGALITSAQGLVDAGRRMHLVQPAPKHSSYAAAALRSGGPLTTPPPDDQRSMRLHAAAVAAGQPLFDDENDLSKHFTPAYLASTPPDSENLTSVDSIAGLDDLSATQADLDIDFDSLINMDAAGDGWTLEDGAYVAIPGEGAGFGMDMNWLKGMKDEGVSTCV